MKRNILITISLAFFLLLSPRLSAQEEHRDRFKDFWGKVDKWLSDRYYNISVDTNYIARPQGKWTVKARYNLTGASLDIRQKEDGDRFRLHTANKSKNTLSVAASYTGITLALTFNPSSLVGWYNDFEYNTNEYYNRMGFDLVVQRAKNSRGWLQYNDSPHWDIGKDLISLRSFNFNYYYVFNHRRFSYPAAFSQSYIQRRSAGSFMLGASFQWQKLHSVAQADDGDEGDEDDDTEESSNFRLKAANVGIGAGYGYNFVIRRDWLLHLSALPTLVVYSRARMWDDDEKTTMPYHFPEFIATGRVALVRNWGRYFAGGTMVWNYTLIGSRDNLQVGHSKWRARAFIGFRF